MKQLYPLVICLCLLSCQGESEPSFPTYSIEQFYQNIAIRGGAFSEDENRLLLSSNESGIFNLQEIHLADASVHPITNSTQESFYSIDYVPGSEDIIYAADKGGNELSHIYLLSSSGETQDLTPGDKEKAAFVKWSQDKQSMYFISTRRNERFFDLYKMKIGEWKPMMIFQINEPLTIVNVSADGNYLVLFKNITTSENELYLQNLRTGERTKISQDQEKGSYRSSGFSKDFQQFYYITDVGKEFAYLVEYTIATGEHRTLFETDWPVMYSQLSEKGTYRVIAINEDGRTSLRIQHTDTGEDVKVPNIPDGDIASVSFSDSEQKMRLTVNSSRTPSNLYVYDMKSSELQKLTETLNPDMDAEALVSAEVVRYPSFDGLEIPAIYYKPHSASPSHKVPALVWVHGGPGGQSRVGYFSLIQYLVNHGYAILAVNNRGSSGYGKTFFKMDNRKHGEDDLQDCVWGKKWLAEQAYIDPDRIGIIGGSYGGYMTMAALTFEPDEFELGVNIFGVTNWLRTLKSIPPFWEAMRKALYDEMGDPNTADSVRLYNISPLFHAHQVTRPTMVLQGANDPRVLQIESDEIVEAVKKNGVPVEYIVFPDEGHGFVKKENEIKGYKQIRLFLDKYLKGKQ
ncbi:MAG: alpha/beta fold hydrolase [Bacteroidota bacterium]